MAVIVTVAIIVISCIYEDTLEISNAIMNVMTVIDVETERPMNEGIVDVTIIMIMNATAVMIIDAKAIVITAVVMIMNVMVLRPKMEEVDEKDLMDEMILDLNVDILQEVGDDDTIDVSGMIMNVMIIAAVGIDDIVAVAGIAVVVEGETTIIAEILKLYIVFQVEVTFH